MNRQLKIRAGWLIDGKAPVAKKDMLLSISGDKISAITRYDKRSKEPAECLDLSHCTLMPCLIDAHVHLTLSGTGDARQREKQLIDGYSLMREKVSIHICANISPSVSLRSETEEIDTVIPCGTSLKNTREHRSGIPF
jgi:N-acetylglucosamine-6-phosphate deacetylase